jgi:5-oxoprolinase (ATP-hydrolysing) subunit C
VGAGEVIQFPENQSGLWTYLAVEGGFQGTRLLGSASVYQRGHLGQALSGGAILRRGPGAPFQLPSGVAGRTAPWDECRNYDTPPPMRVWPGPQWDSFSETDRQLFFSAEWRVTSQSDRVGYRLAGPLLKPQPTQIVSEPVPVGSVQVPENGQPIVTLRDGPTVGGYPKLGMIDPADVSWFTQCRPGQKVTFRLRP